LASGKIYSQGANDGVGNQTSIPGGTLEVMDALSGIRTSIPINSNISGPGSIRGVLRNRDAFGMPIMNPCLYLINGGGGAVNIWGSNIQAAITEIDVHSNTVAATYKSASSGLNLTPRILGASNSQLILHGNRLYWCNTKNISFFDLSLV
jgi:hypothetical protein